MEEQYNPQNYLASVSDIMAGLLFIFMIMLMGFVYQAVSAKASLDEKAESLETMVSDYQNMTGTMADMSSELEKLYYENIEMKERLVNQEVELEEYYEQREKVFDRLVSESARIRSQILKSIWQRLDNRELVTVDHESGVLRLGEDYLNFSSGSTVTNSLENLEGISKVLAGALVCQPEKKAVQKSVEEVAMVKKNEPKDQKNTPQHGLLTDTGKAIGFLKRLTGVDPAIIEPEDSIDETTAKVTEVRTFKKKSVVRPCLPYASKIEALFIEGHTDNVPLGKSLIAKSGLKDNRELSTIRAIHTYNQMLQYAPELANFRNEKGVPVISVSGYGADRPVKGHAWAEIKNDPVNRRIDIRIILSPFIEKKKSLVVES